MIDLLNYFRNIKNHYVFLKKEKYIIKKLSNLGINHKYISINDDFSVNLDNGINLDGLNLSQLNIKFNKIIGDFSAKNCGINNESLKMIPNIVTGSLDISYNDITTLLNGPKVINNKLFIIGNPIDSFDNNLEEVLYIYKSNSYLIDDFTVYSLDSYNKELKKEKLSDLSRILKETIPEKQIVKRMKI